MARVKERECVCGHIWAILQWADGTILNNDRTKNPENLTCPKCDGAEFTPIMGAPRPIEMGGEHGYGSSYPHFNRGLGCEVRSKKHLKELCDARGIVPVEGDVDCETPAQRRATKEEGAIERWHNLQDYYATGPDIELRKAWGATTEQGYYKRPDER